MKIKHIVIAATAALSFSASASELVGIEKYTYDASGNIVEKSIDGVVQQNTYDSGNRLVSAGIKSYQYDQSGRATQISGNGDDKSLSYGYGDRVLQVGDADNSTDLYYNAAGHLVGKSNGDTYIWDENALAAEGDEAYTNEAHIVGGVPIMGSGEVVVSNHLGTTLAKGEQTFQSTAYGEGLEGAMFTGKPYVKELESHIFPHRNYSASEARWTNSDPSGFPDGLNNREYAGGNPLSNVDPDGLSWTQYSDFLTPQAGSKHGNTINYSSTVKHRYSTTFSREATIAFSQSIPQGGSVTISSSKSSSVSGSFGVSIYGVVNIGGTAGSGHSHGVSITQPADTGNKLSKVDCYKQVATATGYWKYKHADGNWSGWMAFVPNNGTHGKLASPVTGYTTAILGEALSKSKEK